MSVCRVPTCPCEAAPENPGVIYRTYRGGLCAVHREWSDDELRNALTASAGFVARLEPATNRIEYDAEGKPVRFYPDTRRAQGPESE